MTPEISVHLLMDRIEAVDREIGLPFGWFFLMVHGHWIDPDVGLAIAQGLMAHQRLPPGAAVQKHFDVNVTGLLLATREAVKLMGPEGGSIVNIGSIVGPMPAPNASVYSASKAAVDAITISLAGELGPRNIRVNSLNPGMVETEGLRASGLDKGAFRDQQERETPPGILL